MLGLVMILLMVQKSGDHQLRLVVNIPCYLQGFVHVRGLDGFQNHQQYARLVVYWACGILLSTVDIRIVTTLDLGGPYNKPLQL